MTRKPVTSSQIKSIGYDPISQTLEIEFQPSKKQIAAKEDGSIYRYSSVSPELYAALLEAKSIGRFYITQIKNDPKQYPFEKIR